MSSTKANTVKAVRGMHDILPTDSFDWINLEDVLRHLAMSYGYQEIRMPVLEQTHLFKRTIGDATDIVEKEMYTFDDRNGDSLSLRPEGTASCVRACMEAGLLHNQQQRLFYMGPMFRHERPQKGRYRQFYQFGLEAFGIETPDIDAEQVLLTQRLWSLLGIDQQVRLEINNLGTAESRAQYRDVLVKYLQANKNELDEDSLRRLETNPLRILDSKNPKMRDVIDAAPSLLDYLDADSKQHFAGFTALLDRAGLAYEINPRLVRGLDYYGLTVYEWVTDSLGAQGTVCAGGRYNSLVELLGGKPTPAVGFALGLERLLLLLKDAGNSEAFAADFYGVFVGEAAEAEGLFVCEALRTTFPALKIVANCGSGSFKSQFKRADKSGAQYALVIGDEELAQQKIAVKPLRGSGEQQLLSLDELKAYIEREIS